MTSCSVMIKILQGFLATNATCTHNKKMENPNLVWNTFWSSKFWSKNVFLLTDILFLNVPLEGRWCYVRHKHQSPMIHKNVACHAMEAVHPMFLKNNQCSISFLKARNRNWLKHMQTPRDHTIHIPSEQSRCRNSQRKGNTFAHKTLKCLLLSNWPKFLFWCK